MSHDDESEESRAPSGVGGAIGLAQEAIGELGTMVPRLIDRGRHQVGFALAIVERLRCHGSPDDREPEPSPEPETSTVVPIRAASEPVTPADAPPASSLAIPEYDGLAASQVLPRLAGLAPDELAAIRDYEVAHRNRRTVLGRLAQLLD